MDCLLLRAFLKFTSNKKLFKYFKSRYPPEQIELFNEILRTRRKMHNIQLSNEYYRNCIKNMVAPSFIQARIKSADVKTSQSMEKVFLADEIRRNNKQIAKLKTSYDDWFQSAQEILSPLDFLRLCKYLSSVDQRMDKKKRLQHQSTVARLVNFRFGANISPSTEHVTNLSAHVLDTTELFVLSHGLSYSLPPRIIKKENVFAEFEVMMAQVNNHHKPLSVEKKEELHARLTDLAYGFCGSPIEVSDRNAIRKCRDALRRLQNEQSIKILKPDKGSGVVILNTNDYVAKMKNILDDKNKFKKLGSVMSADNTSKIEKKIQSFLAKLKDDKELSGAVYESIRPTGSLRPRLYGLPKTHKDGVPLRPILSMVQSAQHKLAQWLTKVIQPVLENLSSYCVEDSFTFAEFVRNIDYNPEHLLCSFDVKSLFTNVPLRETIAICADELYASGLNPSKLTKTNFIELMNLATSSVEFSFNDEMYRQIDGVAMGSPLGPSLANIFVGFQERRLFSTFQLPPVYLRYVDDTFVLLRDENDKNNFHQKLNDLHNNLEFTCEIEMDNKLPFLDVMIEKSTQGYTTSVYRKPTFTGQYVRWNSFCDKRRKTNLVKTLVHRATKICSPEKLKNELDYIKATLMNNGYPERVIRRIFKQKLDRDESNLQRRHGPEKCPIYVKLPYIGPTTAIFGKRIKEAVSRCYYSVSLRIIMQSRPILPSAKKDVLPTLCKSNVIYHYSCHCDSEYVGRTSQTLQGRIKQHVPKYLRDGHNDVSSSQVERKPSSSIGQHLLANPICRNNYSDDRFTILGYGRSACHLKVLEALHISARQPKLCAQKKFVYTLSLF